MIFLSPDVVSQSRVYVLIDNVDTLFEADVLSQSRVYVFTAKEGNDIPFPRCSLSI